MASLGEILEDKKTFPDTQKITLADGMETTLGDLRDQGYFRKQDYTRKTESLAREREAFAREKGEFETNKVQAEQALERLASDAMARAQTIQKTHQDATPDEVEAYIARDPVSQRLLAKQSALQGEITTLRDGYAKAVDAIRQQQQWMYTDLHQRALGVLKPKMDELGVKQDDLIRYAQQHGMPRLDLAFDLMTKDQQIEAAVSKATETATKKAYEKAKTDLAAPAQLPQRRLAPAPPADAPKSLGEAWEAASRDPEILAQMDGLPR